MRLIASFTPQAWISKRAVECDPEGESSWDVTEHLRALHRRERQLAMERDCEESDALRDLPHAPDWVRAWSGPFYVGVQARPETDADRALLGLIDDDFEVFDFEWQLSAGRTHSFRQMQTGEVHAMTLSEKGFPTYPIHILEEA